MNKKITIYFTIFLISFTNIVLSQQNDKIYDLTIDEIEARSLVKEADDKYNSGQYSEAAELYEKIIVLNTDDIRSFDNLATCYYFTGDYKNAIKYYKIVVDYMQSDHTDGQIHYRRDGLYNLACIYSLSGDIDNSINFLKLAIEEGYNNAGFLANDPDLENARKDKRFKEIKNILRTSEFLSEGSNNSDPSPEQIREGVEIVLKTIKERHPNPYRHFTEEEWNKKAQDIISSADTLSEAAYLVELIGMVGMAGDVHSSAFPRGDSLLKYSYPLRFWKFSDGLFVRSASDKYKQLIGAKVISINDNPADEAWDLLMKKFPSENEWMSTYMIQLYIQFPSILHALGLGEKENSGKWTFLTPENETEEIYLESEDLGGYSKAMSTSLGVIGPEGWSKGHDKLSVNPVWLKFPEKNYFYEIIDDKAVYMQINIARNNNNNPWGDFVEEVFKIINENDKIDRLIIDLRHLEGGWHYMAQDIVRNVLKSSKIDKPGALYIITGRITQSAGLAFIGWLEMESYPIIVGEPAGAHPNLYNGAWGNHQPLELPGTQITFRVSTHTQQFTDAIDDRHIIAPDIPVSMTYYEYESGIDNALDTALDFPIEKGHLFFEDSGGREIERYLPWRRPSQKDAFEKN